MYIHDPHMVVEYEAQLLVPEGVSVYSKRRVMKVKRGNNG